MTTSVSDRWNISAASVIRLENLCISFTRRLSAVGILGMLIIGVLASLDVLIMRAIFNSPIVGLNEILQTVFAVAIASVFASGLADRANLQVDIIPKFFGKTVTAWAEVASSIALLIIFFVLAWQCGIMAKTITQRNTNTPKAIPMGLS